MAKIELRVAKTNRYKSEILDDVHFEIKELSLTNSLNETYHKALSSSGISKEAEEIRNDKTLSDKEKNDKIEKLANTVVTISYLSEQISRSVKDSCVKIEGMNITSIDQNGKTEEIEVKDGKGLIDLLHTDFVGSTEGVETLLISFLYEIYEKTTDNSMGEDEKKQ